MLNTTKARLALALELALAQEPETSDRRVDWKLYVHDGSDGDCATAIVPHHIFEENE